MGKSVLAVLFTATLASLASASASYTGYSGAPGSRGSCAGSCHGTSGGTIIIAGFPEVYTPGMTYEVSVSHSGGSSIRNFNGSVRQGAGSATAGEIAAGFNTETYSRTQEPNGIHLSSSSRDSCTFNWTAPEPGVGEVRLYIAGLQGSMGGSNSEIVLVSDQGTGVEELGPTSLPTMAIAAEPTVVTTTLQLRVSTPEGSAGQVLVLDQVGRTVARIRVPESAAWTRVVGWHPVGVSGRSLTAGSYFVVLESRGEFRAGKFVVREV